MKLLVGIDVSSKELEVAMLTSESTKQLFRTNVSNDLNGASEIKRKILELNETYQFEQTVIGMESTSVYSFHPAFFFKNDAELTALNVDAVLLNPRATKRYKDVFEDSKSDTIDAFYIADFLRIGRYTTGIGRQEEYLALQRLTRSRFEVIQSLTRSK
ncbi:IS110 family transposase, partial [Ligilactobacillus salitolerans]|uniref:IS110 family transposase n=1 Tax=Ligilactobacillus salitolerans TaxID=1808352 RepID=UPI001E337B01